MTRSVISRYLLPAALVAAVLVLNPRAEAADAKGNFALRGIGSQTCQAMLDELQKQPGSAVAAASWVLGYISAVNRYEPETFDISPVTDAQSIFNVVVGLCKAHPEVRVQTITNDTLAALGRARVKTDSPLIETKSGNTVASVRVETLTLVQKRLNERGFLKARADGNFGAQTEAAVKDFQKAEKLPVTGVVDSPTIIRLLIEQPAKAKK